MTLVVDKVIETIDKGSIDKIARRLARRDPMLAAVYEAMGPPPLWKRPATFGTFIRIILEQQVSLASAKSTFDRLENQCDGKVDAKSVAALTPDGLRELGFSQQKARYANKLAEDVIEKRFKIGSLRHLDDASVRQSITSRLGMGDWTADVFMMMALLRSDVFPVGDLALVNEMKKLSGSSKAWVDLDKPSRKDFVFLAVAEVVKTFGR